MDEKPGSSVLEIRRLTKVFDRTVAVSDLSEGFRRGEYFCILGPSGCGKSTLLRIVAGFEDPTAGEVFLDGRPLTKMPPERRDVNMVFQNYALFPHLTVHDNVAFGLKMKKRSGGEIRASVREALRLVNLDRYADRYPRQLSGGQQQRVALARAVVNRPLVLLLDEPLSALDKSLRLSMQDELRRIQREVGITFLHVTHDQAEAFSMADRVAVMQEGRFLQVGPPQEVYRRPAGRFVAEFVGSSNLVGAQVAGKDPAELSLPGGIRLHIGADLEPFAVKERLTLCVRPEQVELHLDPPKRETNVLQATLVRVRPMGSELECVVQAGPTQLLARALNRGFHVGLRENASIFLYIDPADILVFPPDPPGGPSPETP